MDDTVTADALACARAAADRYDLTIRELHEVAEHRTAADLLCGVWGAPSPDQLVNSSLLRALAHSGNYVVGAYRDDRLVGVAVGFLGIGHLHSHITGVDRAGQGAGVGFALKQHQRAWALAHGVPAVCWTYDPLVRRNAYFNLHKLGASAPEYLPDFYGPVNDGINTGDTTDRLYVVWQLTAARAVAAAHGSVAPTESGELRRSGAAVALDRVDDEPAPGPAGPPPRPDAPAGPTRGALLVAMPADIEALRAREMAAAQRWRGAVREALRTAFAGGYVIRGATRDGYYVLERSP